MAGLVALVAVVAIDAVSPHFDPDSWVYGVAALIVWGPGMLPGLGGRR